MNVADRAWQIDRLIAEIEKVTSALALTIMDLIETDHDASSEQARLTDLTEKLIVLRFQRAALDGAPKPIPFEKGN